MTGLLPAAVAAAVLQAHAAPTASPPPDAAGDTHATPDLSARAEPPRLAERLDALERRLADEDHRFRRWRILWTVAFGGIAAANLALLPVVSREARIDLYVGAGTSLLGIAPMFLLPQPAYTRPEPIPGTLDPDAARARMEATRVTTVKVTEYQRQARAWPAHAINVGLNAAASALLGFGYDRWTSAALNLVVGVALGEAQIFTQPIGLAQGH